MKVIDLQNMSFAFGKQEIFNNITMSFESGEIIGIVGNNGSGKSVLFKLIAGLIKPQKGEIWVNGKEIGNSIKFAKNIGVLIEEPSFLPDLTAFDNLGLLLSINHKVSKEVIERALNSVGLLEHRNKKVKKFSLGMKKKMGIAQAIMENPNVLLLDEPMNALDEESIDKIRKLILRFAQNGGTVLIASHNKEDIAYLCQKVYRVKDAKLVLE
ncbi:heme ABC exporter ATP-binding protein CcmA [Streptococcus iniae]|uniref:heme ABC exporter ATP-binding protein CcmA n=1 Tax=Streptococcus iniae TaxID=1346 RepID=UPI0008DB0C9A|nr:heme ABC exporter ATP-binding protein CcmA [Streptococcus iniae]OHX26475.1 heme ABC exporter, ATP-binding protein CcmA [Streptococcus iniae]RLV28293.1 heme ABC exporter ATP-binding protein CcmA [Streptococcus iniae]